MSGSKKHSLHCPSLRPGASRQFVAGGRARIGTRIRLGIRVRLHIPDNGTDQTRFKAKSHCGLCRLLRRFAMVHFRSQQVSLRRVIVVGRQSPVSHCSI